MKAHLFKISVASTYAFIPAATAVREDAAPLQAGGAVERILMLAGESLRSGMESFGGFLRASAGMAEPFPMTGAMLWAGGTAAVVLGAMWLGRANLAPLHS